MEAKELGRAAYEAYCTQSLKGARWDTEPLVVKEAWEAAAQGVISHMIDTGWNLSWKSPRLQEEEGE